MCHQNREETLISFVVSWIFLFPPSTYMNDPKSYKYEIKQSNSSKTCVKAENGHDQLCLFTFTLGLFLSPSLPAPLTIKLTSLQ